MRWFWILLFCCVVVFTAFLPKILSTNPGRELLLSWVNRGIHGTLSIEELHLSWLGPQRAEKVELKDKEGHEILQIDSLATDTSLFNLIFDINNFGATTVIHPVLSLERDDNGTSNLERTLSKKEGKTRFPNLKGKLIVKNGEIKLSAPKIQEITISNTSLEYHPEDSLFHLHAVTKEGSVTGEVLASGSLGENGHILAKVDNFPVTILDQLQNTHLYTQAFGEKIDLKIESRSEDGLRMIDATIQSKFLNGQISGEVKNNVFFTDAKSSLEFVMTPAFFQELIRSDLQKDWSLGDKATIRLEITRGEIPLSLDWEKSEIEAKVSLARAELLHASQSHFSLNQFEGNIVVHDGMDLKIRGDIQGKESSKLVAEMRLHQNNLLFSLESEGFPFGLLEIAFEELSVLRKFFGDSIGIKLAGNYSEQTGLDSTFDITSFSTNLHGEVIGEKLDNLSFTIDGNRRFSGGLKDALGEGATFAFKGKAAANQKILSVSTFEGDIESDIISTTIKGNLGKKGTPFTFDLVKIQGNGQLLNLPLNTYYEGAELKEGEFSFTFDGSKNILTAQTKTSFVASEKEGKEMVASLKIRDFIVDNAIDYGAAVIEFDGNLQDFPTAIFDFFTPNHVNLSDLIGPIINLKAKLDYNPRKQTHLKLDLLATAPGFNTELALAVNPLFEITQSKPGHVYWEINNKRYQALVKMLSEDEVTAYELHSKSTLDIEIEKIYCPKEFPEDIKAFICHSGIVGRIEVEPMQFIAKDSNDRFFLESIRGDIFGENFARKIHVDLTGKVSSPRFFKRDGGIFSAGVDLLNLWSDEPLAITGEIDLSRIPVRQILGIVPLDPIFREKANAVLGDYLNASLNAQIAGNEGPINFDIAASNFKGVFPLQLSKDQIQLRDVLKAEITLTDSVSEHFITDINPMLVRGARSDHPIRVFIDPEGFSFPLPWSFKGLRIEKAVVDIGKIYVHNGGAVEELMKFLKAKPPKDKMMSAWFTPVFLSLKDGVLSHERFDMLLHKNVHIALWGRVDLVKSKVWMTLGIAPQTLKQRFNILGINKKDMFQVKMRGKTNDVELDWSSAYTRIGILITRLAGGPPGYIVGGILEQVISALGEEPTPPPTVYPFPWDEKQSKRGSDEFPEVENPPTTSQKKANRKLLEFLIP